MGPLRVEPIIRIVVLLGGMLFVADVARAQAQAPTTDTITARIYNVGALAPLQTESWATSAALCNQPQPIAPSTINPTKIKYNDPANVTQACIFTESLTGPLFSVPTPGSYELTLTLFTVATGLTSAESTP